ncbi:MAG TPA: hypothetical protein VIN58_23495 [Roseateles sp.]
MEIENYHDFSRDGITVQSAMLRAASSNLYIRKTPPTIRWGMLALQTSDIVHVPNEGRFRLELLKLGADGIRQGVDVRVDGAIVMTDGAEVDTLRTWFTSEYEDFVEYSYRSTSGELRLWNVFETKNPAGESFASKWTGNAALQFVQVSNACREYHCSPGNLSVVDLESFVFRLRVTSAR